MRTVAELNNLYANTCAQIGDTEWKMSLLIAHKESLIAQIRALQPELDQATKLEQEEKEKDRQMTVNDI